MEIHQVGKKHPRMDYQVYVTACQPSIRPQIKALGLRKSRHSHTVHSGHFISTFKQILWRYSVDKGLISAVSMPSLPSRTLVPLIRKTDELSSKVVGETWGLKDWQC